MFLKISFRQLFLCCKFIFLSLVSFNAYGGWKEVDEGSKKRLVHILAHIQAAAYGLTGPQKSQIHRILGKNAQALRGSEAADLIKAYKETLQDALACGATDDQILYLITTVRKPYPKLCMLEAAYEILPGDPHREDLLFKIETYVNFSLKIFTAYDRHGFPLSSDDPKIISQIIQEALDRLNLMHKEGKRSSMKRGSKKSMVESRVISKLEVLREEAGE